MIARLLAMLMLLGALASRQAAEPLTFTATWYGPTAVIRWQQPEGVAQTCLYRNMTLIRCWQNLPAERYVLVLGDKGPLDAAAHPAVGDVYRLTLDDASAQASLRFVLALPMVRADAAPHRSITYMPLSFESASHRAVRRSAARPQPRAAVRRPGG